MRVALVAMMLAVGALVVACSSGGGHTGFACNSSGTSFSSDNCKQRIADAQCKDGGTEARGDGGTMLCCVFTDCNSDPFPELHTH